MENSRLLEFFEERAAILEYDGQQERSIAEALALAETESFRHRCEVKYVVDKYRSGGGDAVKSYLVLVEKARGKAPAEKLRTDALDAIKKP